MAKSAKDIKKDFKEHLQTSANDIIAKVKPRDPDALTSEEKDSINILRTSTAGSAKQVPSEIATLTVEDFVHGEYLEPGDIVFIADLQSSLRRLMIQLKKGEFAHVAMVFQTPRHLEGLDEIFLIEASPKGVDIVSLSKFLVAKKALAEEGRPPKDIVVGVRRFEKDWVAPSHRRMAASRMLHFIQHDDYDYSMAAFLATPRLKKLVNAIGRQFGKKMLSINDVFQLQGKFMPDEFICSGFVQYAYFDMVRAAYERSLIPKDFVKQALKDATFIPDITGDAPLESLLACSPRHLAETQNLTWKFIAFGGEVLNVRDNAEVKKFFDVDLPERIKARRRKKK